MRSSAGIASSSLVLGMLFAAACSSTSSTGAPSGGGGGPTTSGAPAGSGGANGTCTPDETAAATVPSAFFTSCSGCHSAYGAAANPAVPNLFASSASLEDFTARVRQGKGDMPAFASAAISDAEIEQTYDYFRSGSPGTLPTCSGADGTQTTNLGCSGKSVTYSPLFAGSATSAEPIAHVDPQTKNIIFRGAGRVRFRHEMEDSFATYHGHYFEGRTFGYILDDSIAAGGTTIQVTFLPNSNQYYSKQAKAPKQQGGA
ncbi:MAG: cytochrome c, partial [Byssovorax sp.]